MRAEGARAPARPMNIIVCGLGYVGATSAACLLKDGHRVVGVDVSKSKVAAVTEGRSPVSEPGVAELLAAGLTSRRLRADVSIDPHIADADMVLVSVGTPGHVNGALDLSQVRAVAAQLGAASRRRPAGERPVLFVFRSTMPPGSMDEVVMPTVVEAAGGLPGDRYEVAFNPEFIRESTSVADYYAPSRVVIGERAKGTARGLFGIYDHIEGPRFEVSFAEAEMIKFADNAYHALKVAFGNEIGRLCLEYDLSPNAVMEMFMADSKLNISSRYLQPGGAFGGSCLPKDVRALNSLAQQRGVVTPVIDGIMRSNVEHGRFLAQRVISALPRAGLILMLGLTFKSKTDDLRESPLVELAETLLGKGYDLKIFDPDIKVDALVGANRRFIQERLPHLLRLLVDDLDGWAAQADLVVIGKAMPGVRERMANDVSVVDLSRL